MHFLQYISSVIPVSDALDAELHRITRVVEIERNTCFMRQGDRCDDLYFVEEGLMRGYYYNEDKEITSWFSKEGEFATSFYSFITQRPTVEFAETLEDTVLVQLPYHSLQKLYRDFPETERLGRLLTEAYYIRLESRFLAMQFTTAKERYDALLDTNPSLVNRAPLGCIASYLGMTQETLSRIRAGGIKAQKRS